MRLEKGMYKTLNKFEMNAITGGIGAPPNPPPPPPEVVLGEKE